MLNRRRFLGAVSGAFFSAPVVIEAQRGKIPLVACLWGSPANLVQPYRMEFETGLQERGWVADRNITLEHRYPESPEAIPRLAAELVALKPDIIFAVTNPVIDVIRGVTPSVPIVMLYAAMPVEMGFVKSMARPGTNLTGLAFDPTPELYGKVLEIFKEAVPRTTRVGILWNPHLYDMSAGMRRYLEAVRAAGRRLSLTLRFFAVTGLGELETLIAGVDKQHLSGMFILPDSFLTFKYQHRIAELTAKRFPTIFVYREHVDAGGLLSYGPSIIKMPRYAAGHVDKLLRGASVTELPVEQPSVYELVINLKTAKGLGLTIPQSVLLRADQVIE
jgi:ABC-type uncharacterized transport system substrate-binding protein